ncbi:hypothetical protein OMP43_17520 [Sphingomonas sp. CBMAI 2297]|uniref:hypothetical protein n=1 Tax=Sphingomonas sp. CBMAI 2297 TaxID=2991720 RepID=UPI0024558A44|nr:hypothetical protein [Sphingomonas sp. CBMAI 2297]MDH4745828.1 hypothetical protein [Sphingomonas sp. CBMAI 2297]
MATKNAADQAETAPANEDIEEFTVAPGRTVTTDDGDVGPGGTVILSVKEGAKLRKSGFLLAEDGSVTVNADGPPTSAGAEIKEQ